MPHSPAPLINKTYHELALNDSASLTRTLTRKDIALFATITGDLNPAHLDEKYAETDIFHHVIGHGMWTGSLFSVLLGMSLPGPGTVYLSQTLKFLHPVLPGETITASIRVLRKHDAHSHVTFETLCLNEKGERVLEGEALVRAPTEKIHWTVPSLPEIELKTKRPPCQQWLRTLTQGMPPLKVAVIHPVDLLSLSGALEAAEAGLIEPLFIGPEHKIRNIAEIAGVSIDRYPLVPTPHSHAAAEKAVELANLGAVEALMKGKIPTDELMEPILHKGSGLRTGRRMSHVFVLDIPRYPKPLLLTDAAINIKPNLMEKRDIVQNAIDLFHALEARDPKVAILSAVETVNEKLPSTLDATALCKMAERGQITGAVLDGPLAFDNAISRESAEVKGIHSSVAGEADVLVVPDIESGNMLYKQLRYFSGAQGAGIVLGAKVPIVLTSRSGDAENRVASCALALLHARKKA